MASARVLPLCPGAGRECVQPQYEPPLSQGSPGSGQGRALCPHQGSPSVVLLLVGRLGAHVVWPLGGAACGELSSVWLQSLPRSHSRPGGHGLCEAAAVSGHPPSLDLHLPLCVKDGSLSLPDSSCSGDHFGLGHGETAPRSLHTVSHGFWDSRLVCSSRRLGQTGHTD